VRLPMLLRALLPLLLLLLSVPALAVELTGQLRGTISDEDGLPIPGVVVNLSSPAMQGGRNAETDAEGRYRFLALPVGQYDVEVLKAGFSKAEATVRVAAGSTVTIDLVLTLARAGAEIEVVAAKPTVDVTATRTGLTVTRQMLRDIPNPGRDYQSATSLAPGVVDNGTGNPNVRGSVSYGNQYYVDGVNTTDPMTNTFSMNMNLDAIEEVQVITGGMDAEYGRAMGGAVNIVTRSGGNTVSADAQVLYRPNVQLYTPLPEEVESADLDGNGQIDRYELPEVQDQQIALNVGGPIVKDRAWFFTGVQLNNYVTTPVVPPEVQRPGDEPMQSREWRSAYLFGKITLKPADGHRVWLHGQTDPTNINNDSGNVYTLPSAEGWWQQGGWLASLGHQWTPDAKTILDTQVSTSNSYINVRPMAWQDCTSYDEAGLCEQWQELIEATEIGASWTADDPDGFSYGPAKDAYYTDRRRSSLVFGATRFVDFLGSHALKAGIQADLMSTHTIRPGYENGVEYWSHDGDPTNLEGYSPSSIEVAENNLEASVSGRIASFYLQDAWQPIDRLTVRPGVRVDMSAFINGDGEKVFSDLTLSPRFGLAYDLSGDGTTRVHAYYGRFYDSGFLEVADLLTKTGSIAGYNWSEQTGTWSEVPAYSYSSSFLAYDDLQSPHSDEIDLGVEKDLGDGWAVGTNFTYEKATNLWEDDEVNLIWNDDGTEVLGSRDGTGETYYRLRTPDDAFVEYTALEFSANRQFDKWAMISSYTWSRAYGRTRDDLTYGSASATYDIAPQAEDVEVGLMPYDTPHAIKIAGSYRDAERWELGKQGAVGYLFGWNFEMSSGLPYRGLYYNDYYGGWYNYQEPLDGNYRLPAYQRLDLKTGISLVQGRTNWDLTIECFNALNNRSVNDVYITRDNPDGTPFVDDEGTPYFGQAQGWQSPRYFQLGLRGEFQ
jgi:hypothetical protein